MKSKPTIEHSSEAGFTIPELLSVLAVTVIFTGLIMSFAISFWRSTAVLQTDNETYVSRLSAGDIIRDTLNESAGLIIQNSIADNNTLAPDPLITNNKYWNPVHAVPGNITNGASGSYTPVIYFRRPSVDASKNVILNGLVPYEDEYVLYLNGTNHQLLMRILINSAASGNGRRTTCPNSNSSNACPADRIVAENIDSVDTRYFSRSGNLINYQAVVDPTTGAYIGPDFPSVEVLELNLHTYKRSTIKGGNDTTSQTVIRVALRNN